MTHPEETIHSGQVFLWRREGEFWYGIDGRAVLRADGGGALASSAGGPPDFFRDSDDVDAIRESLSRDPAMAGLVRRYAHMRVTRQDFFQCLISFIVSANSNIPRIRRNLEAVCRAFGEAVSYDGMTFLTFPDPGRLAAAGVREIAACGTGYRSAYIRDAAGMVLDGVDGDALRGMPYHEARRSLCRIPGVGNKVADCVLLFSLDFLEAVPLDRWVARMVRKMYGLGDGRPPATDRGYAALHDEVAGRLGPYAGYAQQYMFVAAREGGAGTGFPAARPATRGDGGRAAPAPNVV